MRKRLLTMLVLLVAVVTGAWADGIVCTASDLGKVLCTDGSIYENVNAAKDAGKTAAAVIVYVDETNKKGLAIALGDEGSMNWSTAKSTCEGKTAITGVKWCLPSQNQWEQMFQANGGTTAENTVLNTTITTAGGTPLQENATYWSSSEKSPGVSACTMVLISDIVGWGNMTEDNAYQVRACLAFAPPSYAVTLAEGTEDAKNWTIPAEAAEGTTVTATYSGTKKVKSVKAVKKGGAADPMLATPMTIEAITAGSIKVTSPKAGMQYSLDGGATKTAVTTGNIALNVGDKVQFYGNGTSITSYGSNLMSECTQITGSGDGFTCKVYGNIMSLVDEENFATATTLSYSYTFKFLFYNNTKLTDASGLLLPATQLQQSCYNSMFYGCSALTAAPALPATQLAEHCYNSMFNECTALTAAPVLPAKKLVNRCYYAMFNYCKNLATVTCLATSGINKDSSTSYWLDNAGSEVQGTKTVYTVSTANWPSDLTVIPAGWTRVNIDN